MVGFFIALLSGALMSIQGVFNTEVTKTTGMWVGNAWVQLTAFAVCLIAWLIAGRDNPMVLMKVEPRYLLLGGVILGWNYTYSNSGNEPAWPGKSSITDRYRTVDRSLWD